MASRLAERLAAIHETEQQALANRGVRSTAVIGLRARARAIAAYKQGASPDQIARLIRQELAKAAPIVAEGMVSGYLQGLARAETSARVRMGVKLSTFDSVLKVLSNRADWTRENVQSLIGQYGKQAVTVTGEASGKVERLVSEAARNAIAQGLHRKDGIAAIRDAFDSAGATVDNPYLYETLYRDQVGKTYSAGRWQANQAPEIQEILWGSEFVTVGDDRVRDTHAVLDGCRMPKEHPDYGRFVSTPLDWGCRCSTIEIFTDDGALTLPNLPPPGALDAAIGVGFGHNWGAVFAPAA